MSESGIEREDICDSGPARGHRYGCHVFECSGCSLPAGHCDCDKSERESMPAIVHAHDFKYRRGVCRRGKRVSAVAAAVTCKRCRVQLRKSMPQKGADHFYEPVDEAARAKTLRVIANMGPQRGLDHE